jgi:hypothetical protein
MNMPFVPRENGERIVPFETDERKPDFQAIFRRAHLAVCDWHGIFGRGG